MTGLAQQTAADTAPISLIAAIICILAAVLLAGTVYGYAAWMAERERVLEQARLRRYQQRESSR